MFPLLPDFLLPIALVLFGGFVIRTKSAPGPLLTAALMAGLAVFVLRYFWWRVTETLIPPEGAGLLLVGILLVFAIELASWFDAGVLFAQLARRTNRSDEADAHERRLRALPPSDLPHVDVLIATFNEPLDVLERTIIGAKTLDWPADRLHVHVLDDGSRGWLEDYCRDQKVGYLTRPDNAHAKAGNINAALKRTSSEFFMILDADFIPQRNMLFRMVGFFDNPKVGIVQAPHEFFNFDPLQTNLAMRSSLPSDQKMFFREIMRGRDGWDCAFCCGSNSVTRRSAIDEIGGAMPTGSITEDMLLTLAFLRKGYVTRYLCERLAVGLAPESLDAFFVQRSRWAQGALQILYLKEGPFGPGLTLAQRLMFMPTHWLTQSLMQTTALMLPVLYLLFGFIPMVLENWTDLFAYQLPAIFASILCLRKLAPTAYFAAPATILATLQSVRFLPMLLKTLVKPHGHKFRVTPKGTATSDTTYDSFTLRMCMIMMWGMTLGYALAMWGGVAGDGQKQLFPVVSIWSVVNGIILAGVLTVAFSRRVPRKEERFYLRSPARIFGISGEVHLVETLDVSMSGARIEGAELAGQSWYALQFPGVAPILAFARWSRNGSCGLEFFHFDDAARQELIALIFTQCDDTIQTEDNPGNVVLGLLASVFLKPPRLYGGKSLDPPDLTDEVSFWYVMLAADAQISSSWDIELGRDAVDELQARFA